MCHIFLSFQLEIFSNPLCFLLSLKRYLQCVEIYNIWGFARYYYRFLIYFTFVKVWSFRKYDSECHPDWWIFYVYLLGTITVSGSVWYFCKYLSKRCWLYHWNLNFCGYLSVLSLWFIGAISSWVEVLRSPAMTEGLSVFSFISLSSYMLFEIPYIVISFWYIGPF